MLLAGTARARAPARVQFYKRKKKVKRSGKNDRQSACVRRIVPAQKKASYAPLSLLRATEGAARSVTEDSEVTLLSAVCVLLGSALSMYTVTLIEPAYTRTPARTQTHAHACMYRQAAASVRVCAHAAARKSERWWRSARGKGGGGDEATGTSGRQDRQDISTAGSAFPRATSRALKACE